MSRKKKSYKVGLQLPEDLGWMANDEIAQIMLDYCTAMNITRNNKMLDQLAKEQTLEVNTLQYSNLIYQTILKYQAIPPEEGDTEITGDDDPPLVPLEDTKR